MTVGELRKALEGVPDGLSVYVTTSDDRGLCCSMPAESTFRHVSGFAIRGHISMSNEEPDDDDSR